MRVQVPSIGNALRGYKSLPSGMPYEGTGPSHGECPMRVQVPPIGNALRGYMSLPLGMPYEGTGLSSKTACLARTRTRNLESTLHPGIRSCGGDGTPTALPPVRGMLHDSKVFLGGMLDKGSQAPPIYESKDVQYRSQFESPDTELCVPIHNGGYRQLTSHTHFTSTNGMKPVTRKGGFHHPSPDGKGQDSLPRNLETRSAIAHQRTPHLLTYLTSTTRSSPRIQCHSGPCCSENNHPPVKRRDVRTKPINRKGFPARSMRGEVTVGKGTTSETAAIAQSIDSNYYHFSSLERTKVHSDKRQGTFPGSSPEMYTYLPDGDGAIRPFSESDSQLRP